MVLNSLIYIAMVIIVIIIIVVLLRFLFGVLFIAPIGLENSVHQHMSSIIYPTEMSNPTVNQMALL